MSDGCQTLPEAEFLWLCHRAGLPLPDRQVHRRDAHGRVRWLDFHWRAYGLVAEIDGLAHMNLQEWHADMLRDADLLVDGLRVLRLPNVLVLEEATRVAGLVRGSLLVCGWQPPPGDAAGVQAMGTTDTPAGSRRRTVRARV
jgi:very-short-patch-repair endonuclease